jgi:hypothetical protein
MLAGKGPEVQNQYPRYSPLSLWTALSVVGYKQGGFDAVLEKQTCKLSKPSNLDRW